LGKIKGDLGKFTLPGTVCGKASRSLARQARRIHSHVKLGLG